MKIKYINLSPYLQYLIVRLDILIESSIVNKITGVSINGARAYYRAMSNPDIRDEVDMLHKFFIKRSDGKSLLSSDVWIFC